MVERVDNEGANQTRCQEDDGIDKTDDPLVFRAFVDAELLREGQVGTV